MVTFKEFSAIFKGTDFTNEELRKFYYSVRKSIILRLVGKRSWPEIFKLEGECQWPVLRNIGDPGLPIYEDADKALLERFIKTISEEKNLREYRSSFDKVRYWSLLQSVIDERIELFTRVFGFSKKEVEHCRTVAERYSKIRDRRIKTRKKMWKIGIGTGAATLAGAAALWYISKKDKK
ncbi:MAG: hypothetical protein AB1442_18205 [Nitrospirota bacterium]